MTDKIVFCQCTHGEQEEWTKRNISIVKPFTDRMIIIHDGTISETTRTILTNDGCELYECKFNDNFSQYRNEYISRVENDNWILATDPDEILTDNALVNIRKLIQTGPTLFKLLGTLVKIDSDGNEQIFKSDFHKPLLFKKNTDTQYTGLLHETIIGTYIIKDVDLEYLHYKTESDEIERSCRNFFVAGGGHNDESNWWSEWKIQLSTFGINNWLKMKHVIRNDIPRVLEDWIVRNKDKSNYKPEVDHEIQAFFKWHYNVLGHLKRLRTFEKKEIISDLEEFFDDSDAENNLENAPDLYRAEWESTSHESAEEILKFYKTSKMNCYDLARWHCKDAEPACYEENTMEFYEFLLSQPAGINILDYGAGIGTVCIRLAQQGYTPFYYDIGETTQAFAEFRANKYNAPVTWVENIEDIVNKVEIAVSYDVFEHMKDDEMKLALQRIYKALVPGGHFFIVTQFPLNVQEAEGKPSHLTDHIGKNTRTIHPLAQSVGFQLTTSQNHFIKPE